MASRFQEQIEAAHDRPFTNAHEVLPPFPRHPAINFLLPLVGYISFFALAPGEFPSADILIAYALLVWLIAGLAVLLIGLPCVRALIATETISFLSLSATGVLLAMIPNLIFAQPHDISDYTAQIEWHGLMLQSDENGDTLAGAWLRFVASSLWFGLHGFICSTVFYTFWRRSIKQAA